MKQLLVRTGNLWDFFEAGFKIVVTTNIGWNLAGRNNMGAGIALEAWRRYEDLADWYGAKCKEYESDTPVMEYAVGHGRPSLILFPVKPLNKVEPAYSWNQKASLKLINRSARQLAALARRQNYTRIALGFPGCGNGALEQSKVMPILRKHLDGARFVIVDRQPDRRYALGHGASPA